MPLVQERERKEGEKESGNRGRHTKKGREKGREGGGGMWIGLQQVR